MGSETVFETTGTYPRDDIADYLEQVAENFRHGEVTLVSGDSEVTVSPPEKTVFETKVERGEGDITVSFEIGWEEEP